ncbi:prepilin peptidase [Microbacterium testaceum]|uniref:prepilin peptidase n=1 Tax=Microbacterium testaceum TaxID=2033 RepID=UPI0025B0A561|nr:prepilin peptidase [Microbacterium testaceum]WJS92101.1 prepilin peptidase [Microbacterium testaceum]
MPVLVALAAAVFAVASVGLVVVDVRTHRLPDAVVLSALVVVAGLLTAEALRVGDTPRAVGVVGGAGATFAVALALHLGRPGAFGGGDVKLAALVGAPLGWYGPEAVASGLLIALLLGGVAAAGVLLAGGRRVQIAYGPWLLLGAWLRLLSGPGEPTPSS